MLRDELLAGIRGGGLPAGDATRHPAAHDRDDRVRAPFGGPRRGDARDLRRTLSRRPFALDRARRAVGIQDLVGLRSARTSGASVGRTTNRDRHVALRAVKPAPLFQSLAPGSATRHARLRGVVFASARPPASAKAPSLRERSWRIESTLTTSPPAETSFTSPTMAGCSSVTAVRPAPTRWRRALAALPRSDLAREDRGRTAGVAGAGWHLTAQRIRASSTRAGLAPSSSRAGDGHAAAARQLRGCGVTRRRLGTAGFRRRDHNDGAVLAATADALDELIGFVAAEANHEPRRRRRQQLDAAFVRTEHRSPDPARLVIDGPAGSRCCTSAAVVRRARARARPPPSPRSRARSPAGTNHVERRAPGARTSGPDGPAFRSRVCATPPPTPPGPYWRDRRPRIHVETDAHLEPRRRPPQRDRLRSVHQHLPGLSRPGRQADGSPRRPRRKDCCRVTSSGWHHKAIFLAMRRVSVREAEREHDVDPVAAFRLTCIHAVEARVEELDAPRPALGARSTCNEGAQLLRTLDRASASSTSST